MLFGEPMRKCIVGKHRLAVVYVSVGAVRMRLLLRQSDRRISPVNPSVPSGSPRELINGAERRKEELFPHYPTLHGL